MKAAPRLGAGLDEHGLLERRQSMRSALEALGTHGDARAAARRDARRGGGDERGARRGERPTSSLARVRAETGLTVRVLDGEDEARLSFRSALAHFDLGVGRAVVMDIGGGSLELALSADGLLERLDLAALRRHPAHRAVTSRDGSTPKALEAAAARGARGPSRRASRVRDWRGAQVIGSGGTFTNLGGDPSRAAGHARPRATCTAPRAARRARAHPRHAAAMSPGERATVPGLNPERADIIVAGLAVAAEVLARLESRELIVSRYGIREGLLLETARVAPTLADPRRGARALGARVRRALSLRGAARATGADARAAAVRRDRRAARLHAGRTGRSSPTPRCCTTSATTSTTTSTTSTRTT